MAFDVFFADEKYFDKVYELYRTVCKVLESSPYSPHWEIDEYPNKEDLHNLIEKKELLVCTAGDKIIGSVAVFNGENFDDGLEHPGEPVEGQTGIRLFAVLPGYRGMGVSDAMIARAKEVTGERGHNELVLLVAKGNTPAENLYKRNGFKFVKETIFYDSPDCGHDYYAYKYEVSH